MQPSAVEVQKKTECYLQIQVTLYRMLKLRQRSLNLLKYMSISELVLIESYLRFLESNLKTD